MLPNYDLTGPKPKEITVETFRIDYLIRTPKVEKLSLQPIRDKDTRLVGCNRGFPSGNSWIVTLTVFCQGLGVPCRDYLKGQGT